MESKNKFFWQFLWLLLIGSAVYLRLGFCDIASWPRDQAAFLWLSMNCAYEGFWPPVTMVTSTGIYNPNGASLFGALLAFLPGGVKSISIFLTLAQGAASLFLVSRLPLLNQFQKWLLAALLLSNPYIIACSIDFWMPWSLLIFGCFFPIILNQILEKKPLNLVTWAGLFFLAFYFPIAYLGHITYTAAFFIVLIILKIKRKIEFNKSFYLGMFISISILSIISVFPYLSLEAARSRIYEALFGEFHENVFNLFPRDFSHVLRALTHPWRLLVDPRQFFWYSSINVISEDTETGLWGSFRSLSYLTAGLMLLGACLGGWVTLKTKRFKFWSHPPLTSSLIRYIFLFYALILTLFFIMPSKFFYNESKGISYLIFLWLILFYFLISVAKKIKYGNFIFSFLLLTIFLCQYGLTKNIIEDHLTYQGDYVSWAGVPLIDRQEAMTYIASKTTQKTANIGYDFFHGNRKPIEKETLYYAKNSQLGSLAAGRLYDCELWMHHGIKNINPHLTERDHRSNDFLVTWFFVDSHELSSIWQDASFKDFGRVRVYEK